MCEGKRSADAECVSHRLTGVAGGGVPAPGRGGEEQALAGENRLGTPAAGVLSASGEEPDPALRRIGSGMRLAAKDLRLASPFGPTLFTSSRTSFPLARARRAPDGPGRLRHARPSARPSASRTMTSFSASASAMPIPFLVRCAFARRARFGIAVG